MTPAEVLRDALSDGVRVAVTPSRTIKICGEPDAVGRWAAVLREHKPTVMDALALPAAMATEFGPVELLEAPDVLPTEPSNGASAGFDGTSEGDPGDVAARCSKAMRTLRRLHGAHEQRMCAAGIDGIARVRLSDWLAALRFDRDLFPDIVRNLEQSGAILREHGYARPAPTDPGR